MNINNIISEEINKVVEESKLNLQELRSDFKFKKHRKRAIEEESEILRKLKRDEKKKKKHSKKADEIKKKIKNRDGNEVSSGDEERINDLFDDNLINLAAIARKVYPHHTPEGAQSQLRKKIKQLKNDTGKKYHLTQREAGIINKAIKDIDN